MRQAHRARGCALSGAPPRGAAAQGEEAVETQIELLDVCFSDLLAPVQPASADNAAATPAVSAATALGGVARLVDVDQDGLVAHGGSSEIRGGRHPGRDAMQAD